MYTLFFISEDIDPHGDPTGEWSVYSERYETIDATEPIEGTCVVVSGNLTHDEADALATSRQRLSYVLARTKQEA